MRFSLSTLVALGALQTLGVFAQESIPACVNRCVNEVRNNYLTYECESAGQADCICTKPAFTKGVSECTSGCAAGPSDIESNLNNDFCRAFPVVVSDTVTSAGAPTSAVETTSEALPTTTEALPTTEAAPSTSVAPTSSSAAVEAETTSSQVAETTAAPPTSVTTAAESTSVAESASAAETASATEESSATSVAAGGADATSSSSAGEDESDKGEESSRSGLSKGAQIGIGIGVAAGVLALIGIALCFFLRRRRNQQHNLPRGNVAISQPMPGGGRTYASGDHGSIGEKHGYDIEMMSHRYEDMVPRTKPRTMV
ncbi:hypothetical protein ACJ41O_004893 [Fusarium nematophilum]